MKKEDEMRRRKLLSEAAKYKTMLDEDFYHEEDPMGQTVVQGQQTEEWKEENPFESARLESVMDRATKKSIDNYKKGK